MAEIRALIAAAGRGSRAGLSYPKTLFALQGKPILVRLLDVLARYDPQPTVVVSPEGEAAVRQCLAAHGQTACLVTQEQPRGMGDAVLKFEQSPRADQATHVLLVWGDIPFIQPDTVAALVRAHLEHGNDFTLATRVVDSAYTVVSRGQDGRVRGVIETREAGIQRPQPGERDIGLFLFRKDLVMRALREDVPEKWGRATSEHGFLYIIGLLAARGVLIEALPIATELDLVSLNSVADVQAFF